MDAREKHSTNWGGWLWLVAVVAIVLAVVVLVVITPRPLAYISPVPTAIPWTAAPGMYIIPTPAPPTPTVATPAPTP